MEVIEGRHAPEAYAEIEALITRGVLPRGTAIWRSTSHSQPGLAIAPDWYGRRDTRHCGDGGWTPVELPDDVGAPALRRVLAPDAGDE